ncbi:MAG: histidine kinase, partial [Acidobacteria bacterium]|nr:histidine kinase [Acidobacteriota bacterium]
HELNNPLATVSLRVEELLSGVPERDPRRRSLEVVEQELERMGNLVSNLLQFSRRNHRLASTFDVREEIGNTLELIHYRLRNRRTEVERAFGADVPMVQADRQALRQMFLNLLTNASDAMPEGGKLWIRVSGEAMVSGVAGIRIEFEDTGVGIAPEELPKVMEPFYTTKAEGQGTGLGLAICRRVVQEHAGTIEITSRVGEGTLVRVVLPVMSGANEDLSE